MIRLGVLEHCMLVVEGLTCRFGTKAAADNASFSIAPGGFVGVIGRSGAGKSTLLRTINRRAPPTEGRILYKGVDVTALRGKELRQWRGRPARLLPQFNNLAPPRAPPHRAPAGAMSACEAFGMAPPGAAGRHQRSGGPPQRVAVSPALVQEPDIIL